MPHINDKDLILALTTAQRQIEEAIPIKGITLHIFINRSAYNNNLNFTMSIYKDYNDPNEVKGVNLSQMITEYQRRNGFDESQKLTLLEPPSVDITV